jgi:uncharacterized glyoxalase superfamily protein PhnB
VKDQNTMTLVATDTKSTIIPALRYRDAPAAMDWLCTVLGFERHVVFTEPTGGIAHAELTLGGGMIMLGSQKDDDYGRRFKSPQELGGFESHSTYVVVPDADAVYARAQAAGAAIIKPIYDTHYGSREFIVRDPEGHTWTLGSYDPWVQK